MKYLAFYLSGAFITAGLFFGPWWIAAPLFLVGVIAAVYHDLVRTGP